MLISVVKCGIFMHKSYNGKMTDLFRTDMEWNCGITNLCGILINTERVNPTEFTPSG